MLYLKTKKNPAENSDVLVHIGKKQEWISLLGQIPGNCWKKVSLLSCSLASVKHSCDTDELIFPRHMHFQKFYWAPIGVLAAEDRPRSYRQHEGHKDKNCFGQERANGSHTCESEVHWLGETWWDKHKHRVNGGPDRKAHGDVDLSNFWRKQALTFNQTGVFPHRLALPSLQLTRDNILPPPPNSETPLDGSGGHGDA